MALRVRVMVMVMVRARVRARIRRFSSERFLMSSTSLSTISRWLFSLPWVSRTMMS